MADDDDDADALDPVGPARPLLVAATRLADRIDRGGDPDGAADVLACAARLTRKVRGLGEVADFRLDRALDEAENEGTPADRLGALRDGIESLLGDPEDEPDPLPNDPLPLAQALVGVAVGIGAPAYNTGDKQGCYEVYAATAAHLLDIPELPEEAAAKLRDALDKCDGLDDPEARAWALRHAFDAVGEMGPGGAGLAPREVKAYLAMAVGVGAPAFNLGDHRGCYEVYATAARLLVNSQAVPDGVKEPLRAALAKASAIPGVTRQAWVMREAFDALLSDQVEPPKEGSEPAPPEPTGDGPGNGEAGPGDAS